VHSRASDAGESPCICAGHESSSAHVARERTSGRGVARAAREEASHHAIVGRYRAVCSEETLLLGEIWSSVSTALHAELEDADATLPVTPGAGAPVPGAGRELGDHAAALRATAPAACSPGRATPKKARASVPGVGLRGHTSPRSALRVKAMPARRVEMRRTTREP